MSSLKLVVLLLEVPTKTGRITARRHTKTGRITARRHTKTGRITVR